MNGSRSFTAWCILMQLLFIPTSVKASWSYDDMDEWLEENKACGGKAQSPIDLRPENCERMQSTEPFKFTNYDEPQDYTDYEVMNNGHTVVTTFTNNSDSPIRVSGAGLGNRVFALQQFHFHWGSTQSTGSEHTVNSDHYSMEIHLVHFNTSYGDFDTASSKPRGLAVLGVFVLIGDEDHPAFENIIELFKYILYKNEKADAPRFALKGLLPNNTQDFYRYDGSLTTPPCFESVIWTLFRTPIYISQRQISEFRKLHEEENDASDENDDHDTTDHDEHVVLLVNNFRPVQPLNGRIVQRSFDYDGQDWYYEDPVAWSLYYPMCDGVSQSPIDISSSAAVPAATTPAGAAAVPLSFSGFSSSKSITLTNTGFTVEGRLGSSSAPSLAGGVLAPGSRYLLYRVSLHFSLANGTGTRGTEHSIDGAVYPLEIQLLFYNSKYSNSSEAERQENGIAGLAIFGQVQNGSSLPLLDYVEKVQSIHSEYTVNNFMVESLLPSDCCRTNVDESGETWKHEYYSYNGSLTVPSCQQTVTWTVLPNPVFLSASQMNALRSLNLKLTPDLPSSLANNGSTTPASSAPAAQNAVTNNCRPSQRINGRTVLFYSQSQSDLTTSNSSPTNHPPNHSSRMQVSTRNFLLFVLFGTFIWKCIF